MEVMKIAEGTLTVALITPGEIVEWIEAVDPSAYLESQCAAPCCAEGIIAHFTAEHRPPSIDSLQFESVYAVGRRIMCSTRISLESVRLDVSRAQDPS